VAAISNFTLSCIHPLRTTLHYYSSHVNEAIVFNLQPPVTRDCFTVKGEETNCFAAKRVRGREEEELGCSHSSSSSR
jgi:hypothetical protein